MIQTRWALRYLYDTLGCLTNNPPCSSTIIPHGITRKKKHFHMTVRRIFLIVITIIMAVYYPKLSGVCSLPPLINTQYRLALNRSGEDLIDEF